MLAALLVAGLVVGRSRTLTAPAAGNLEQPDPGSAPTVGFGRRDAIEADPAVGSALQPLIAANLENELPRALGLIANLRAVDSNSKVESTFGELIADPNDTRMKAFMDAAATELRDRRLDFAHEGEPKRPEGEEPQRQLALRMVLAVQYARARGLMTAPEADKALWEATIQLESSGEADLHELLNRVVEDRLGETLADEQRWDPVAREDDPEAEARHWVRGMLDLAMEFAARDGRAEAFEGYAERYVRLGVPGTPEFRERDEQYRRERAREFRRVLEARIAPAPPSPPTPAGPPSR